jgi:caffeoyl-CoA O-methyltransferase
MSDELEQYLSRRYWTEDDVLREVRADIAARGPQIQVSAEAGRLLALLVRAAGATRVLEVGTLFGYSGIWMARELPAGGRLDTIEIEKLHADAAEHWFERAGLADRVTVHRGAGVDVLATLPGPYDVAFIDADKDNYPAYGRMALERLRPGGIVIADNAIRSGRIALAGQGGGNDGIRALHDLFAGPDLVATTVPVGDGLAIAVKKG